MSEIRQPVGDFRRPTVTQHAEALPELMRLAKSLTKKFRRQYLDIDLHELVSAANLGVTQAIKNYRPDRGATLTTYAYGLVINRLKDVVIAHYGRMKQMPELSYDDDIMTGGIEEDVLAHQSSPEDEVLNRDEITKARDFLRARLNDQEWDKLYRYYYLDQTMDEIGQAYHVTGAAIGDLFRKKIKPLLEKFRARNE
ncbi:MAG: sigma-70 family RNA polymerase sigma factor [Candidatus Kerfeldbacteria bacterium]|nr:sigma-70 family RNA polymerase sigma factor [Candidatus Kerfeldbacteria bacterium]